MPLPIHVLSLPLATGRRDSVAREFSRHGLDFSFFDAIDGADIPDHVLRRQYDGHLNARHYKRPLSRGEVACALGHRAIWREVAHGGHAVGLVCEDDLILSAQIRRFLEAVAAASGLFENVMIKLDSPPRRGQRVGYIAGTDILLTRKLPAHTTGYLVGRAAARRLLDSTATISRPIDAELKHYWEHRVPILISRPALVSFQRNGESSLASLRAATRPATGWHRFVRNLRYQSALNLGRLRSPLSVTGIPELLEMRRLLARAR